MPPSLPAKDAPELSLVVPMYNEEAAITSFFEAVRPVLDKIGLSYDLPVSRGRMPGCGL
jgi:hypothetical protein